MKRIITFVLILSLLGTMVPCRALELSAESAVLYDPLTLQILFEKNAHERRSIASTTKIMTALVALEHYDLQQEVVIQPEWTGIEGSSMYLKPGETVQIVDLLYGLLLMSGNDAAVALSCQLTGEQDDFVRLMNRKAMKLGLKNTSFSNPNGLEEEGHYSTAYDLACLMAAAMENEAFAEIVGTAACMRAGRSMRNHNKLLKSDIGCIGGKTGYTRKAGRCLVSAAEQNERCLIAVTLHAPDDWNDHRLLYDKWFSGMERTEICNAGTVAEIPVVSGREKRCRLYAEKGFSAVLLPGQKAQLQQVILGPRFVYGPIRAGQQYGKMAVLHGEKILFETPLYYETEISAPQTSDEKNGFLPRLLSRIIGSVS